MSISGRHRTFLLDVALTDPTGPIAGDVLVDDCDAWRIVSVEHAPEQVWEARWRISAVPAASPIPALGYTAWPFARYRPGAGPADCYA